MSKDTVAGVADPKMAVVRTAYEVTAEYRSPALLDAFFLGARR
jgi:hypothetical protein